MRAFFEGDRELGQCGFELAVVVESGPQGIADIRIVGKQGQRRAIGLDGFGPARKARKCVTKISVGLGQVGIDLDGAAISLCGLLESPGIFQRDAQIYAVFGNERLRFDRALEHQQIGFAHRNVKC